MVGYSFPVEQGIVHSLARPGGNITGLSSLASTDIVAKRVELIKELLPNMRRLVYLNEDDNPPEAVRAAEDACRRKVSAFYWRSIPRQTLRMPSTLYVGNALTPCM
jgi:ABC-type uncharacterized transport system substrate-binding protein